MNLISNLFKNNGRKLAEDELRKVKEFNETIFDSMSEGFTVIDSKDLKILKTNRAFLESLRLEEKDVIGKHCYEVTHKRSKPCESPGEICPLNETLKTGRYASAEHIHYDKEGKKRYMDVSTSPIKNSNGEVSQIVHISRDITEKKQAEEALKESYHMQKIAGSILRTSLENISIREVLEFAIEKITSIPWFSLEPMGIIFLVDEDDPAVLVMKAWRGIGEAKQRVCGRVPFGKCLCGRVAASGKLEFASHIDKSHENDPQDIGPHGHYCVPIMSAEKVLGVFNLYLKDGHQRTQKEEDSLISLANMLSQVIQRKRGEEELARAYERLKDTQTQLVQTAKLAALGQLAGGIAHEINNPLTGVLNNVQLIKMVSASTQDFNLNDFKELLDVIEDSALRCKKITESLLDFSHASIGTFQPVSLNIIIDKIIGLINNEMKLQSIDVKRDLQPNLPDVQGDPQLLQQVIVNLISNAKWAIEKKFGKRGGSITITAKTDAAGKRIQLDISDNGIGMPEDKLNKIFEPFFTTKQVGAGTGLGLYIVSNIIRKHKGTIEVSSRINEGATFKISLPVL